MQQTPGRTPRTAAELETLRAQREELTNQLEQVTERRGRLGQERMNARARGDMAMVQEYDATIAQLGQRMNALERQQTTADRLIAEAVAGGVGQRSDAGETRVITLPGGQTFGIGNIPGPIGVPGGGTLFPPRDLSDLHTQYQRMMALEAAGFILLGAIVSWFVWKRARRSVGPVSGGEIAGLRTSVDAIAIEVERISENQRYVTKLLTEGGAMPLARQSAEPVGESRAQRGTPERR